MRFPALHTQPPNWGSEEADVSRITEHIDVFEVGFGRSGSGGQVQLVGGGSGSWASWFQLNIT